MKNKKYRIAIFASGGGSNAEQFFKYYKENNWANVSLVLTNKKDAFVIERAQNYNLPVKIFNREEFYTTDATIETLKEYNIDIIVLAGFLWKIPDNLIKIFPEKIINIHPALLPKYGGKGMYGINVHRAVIAANEKESGITIHVVNENYDEGKILSQEKCEVLQNDTPELLAKRVLKLEHEFYPKVVEVLLHNL